MSDYTPTGDQIRDSYRSHDALQAAAAGFTWEERGAEFDRWLSAHDAKVRAEALREAQIAIGSRIDPDDGSASVEFINAGLRNAIAAIRADLERGN